tara:strand:+ start:4022 stop:4456 length:435 start_codon:yes stop_codon:yes gene_type:complete
MAPLQQSVKCSVCDETGAKYKCPGCGARYCSVKCNKSHKEVCSPASKLDSILPPGDQGPSQSRKPAEKVRFAQTDESLPLSHVDLQKLCDPDIAQALSSNNLQSLIQEILSSPNPQDTLDTYLDGDQDFANFMKTVINKVGMGM